MPRVAVGPRGTPISDLLNFLAKGEDAQFKKTDPDHITLTDK